MAVNAGSRRNVQAQGQVESSEIKLAAGDLREVMATQPGRRFVLRLLSLTGVEDEPRYVSNAMDLARDNGARTIGMALLTDIREVCPEAEVAMRGEHRLREQRARMQLEATE